MISSRFWLRPAGAFYLWRRACSRVLNYVFITIAKIIMEILKVVVQYEK